MKAEMETTDDIIRLLQKTGNISDGEVVIISDGYSENKNALGSYVITLEQGGIQTNVVVNVEGTVEYLSSIELPKTVQYNVDLSDRPAFLNMIYDVCCRVKAFFEDFFKTIF